MGWRLSNSSASVSVFLALLTFAIGASSEAAAKERFPTYLVVVDKSQLEARLERLRGPLEEPELVGRFEIALGKAKGDKVREGDHRTPEGIYFTRRHIPGRRLLRSKYGDLAIPLDYPNPMDRRARKTGYGIWLHGAGDDRRIAEEYVTEGCVIFFNKDIIRLARFLRPGKSAVMIVNNRDGVNQMEDRAALRRELLVWRTGWSLSDFELIRSRYTGEYQMSRPFRKARRLWGRAFTRFQTGVKMEIDGLQIISHQKYAVSFFNQRFSDKGFKRLSGQKILYWLRTENGWKVIHDETKRGRFFDSLSYKLRGR